MNKHFLLRSHFDSCMGLISELQTALEKTDLAFCHYYQLPKIKESTQAHVINEIPVILHNKDQGLIRCNRAYTDFIKQTGYSGKMLVRHPGIIAIKGENPKIEQLLNAINNEKHNFKQVVLTEKTKDARFELVHSAIPNLITLAFYRQLYFEKRAAYSIRFTWMHKHSIQHLNKQQAMDLLKDTEQQERRSEFLNQNKLDQLEQEKYRIASLKPNQKLRIRRPISVSPQVNVRFSASDRYHVSAAQPFILFNADKVEKIGQLANYVKKVDPRQKKSRYLIERLFLESN